MVVYHYCMQLCDIEAAARIGITGTNRRAKKSSKCAYRLDFRVGFQAVLSQLPTNARHLVPSEGHLSIQHIVAVHPGTRDSNILTLSQTQ